MFIPPPCQSESAMSKTSDSGEIPDDLVPLVYELQPICNTTKIANSERCDYKTNSGGNLPAATLPNQNNSFSGPPTPLTLHECTMIESLLQISVRLDCLIQGEGPASVPMNIPLSWVASFNDPASKLEHSYLLYDACILCAQWLRLIVFISRQTARLAEVESYLTVFSLLMQGTTLV